MHLKNKTILITGEDGYIGPRLTEAPAQEVLGAPEYAKMSNRDSEVLLYYKFYNDIFRGKYMIAAAKILPVKAELAHS